MSERNLEKEIDKLQYQLRLLSETLDFQRFPIPYLVIEMNWDDDDLNKAHDIFEKYDKKMHSNEDINWTAFEHELRNEFSIGYQTVKSIVLAFFDNNQWLNVCKAYAKSHECSEFHRITRGVDY